MSNKWRISLLAAIILMAVGVGFLIAPSVYGTATATGGPYYTRPLQAGQSLIVPIDWGTTSTDAAVTVTIPAGYGCPDGILGWIFEDTSADTGDSALSAATLGEFYFMTPASYGAADLEDNQLTVYRSDIGGGTFTINVRSNIVFYWLPNG